MTPTRVGSVDEWADVCSGAFVPLRVRGAAPEFSAALARVELVPGVSLARVTSDGSEVYRSDRVIAIHPRDDLLLSFHRDGKGIVRQHGREARLGKGSAAAYDASAPYTLTFPAQMSEVVLQLPRSRLGTGIRSLPDITARTLPDSPAMRGLTHLVTSRAVMDPGRDRSADGALVEAIEALVRAILAPEAGRTALSAELLGQSIRAYVRDHLADPTLDPEKLAAEHHVSLRFVQKMFAKEGESPAAYIRRQRLIHSRALLLAGETVGMSAFASGFRDVDTFTRAFKREFGHAPSASHGRAAAPGH